MSIGSVVQFNVGDALKCRSLRLQFNTGILKRLINANIGDFLQFKIDKLLRSIVHFYARFSMVKMQLAQMNKLHNAWRYKIKTKCSNLK
jgi:hypothetical protein